MTPIGWMPGSLILANAVQSLGHYGELRTPSLGMTVLVEAGLIIIMSWSFARFRSLWGSLLSGLVVLLVLLPASLLLFRYGTWLSFAVPLIAILLHKLIAEIEASLGDAH
jgi:CHASE2 domain-containing sensor protein